MRDFKRFEIVNLVAMRDALDEHNRSCDSPARAFVLNPIDHGLLRWDKLWGLPVLASEEVAVKSFRIACDGTTTDAALPLVIAEAPGR